MLPRSRGSSSRTSGARRGVLSSSSESTRGRVAIAITPVLGASGASCAKTSGVDGPRQLVHARSELGRELRCETGKLGGVTADDVLQLRSEAQRVLERMKALQHGELGIASGAPEARDERPVLHPPIIARVHRVHALR